MKKIIADAKQLLVDVDLFKAPINPIEVCQKLDIIYDEKAYTGFDGIFMATASRQLIGVNSNIKEQGRKNFTCAHEIGHYHYDLTQDGALIKCTRDDTGFGKQKLPDKEVRANSFASELLMPQDLFTKELNNQKPSWSAIETLAAKFGASLQAAAHRFVRLSGHTCWLVVVKNGKLQRFTKADHNDFAPDLNGTFRVPKTVPADWQTTLATSWLYSNKKTNGKEILYWPLKENQYGESLVLLWDSDNILLEDNYEESEDDDGYGNDDDRGGWGGMRWPSRR